MPKNIDPLVLEFLAKEVSNDSTLIPYSRTRRILRKVYRLGKAGFLGVPIVGWAIRDIFVEVAHAGTEKMCKKLPVAALVTFVPAGVIAGSLSIYKVASDKSVRTTAAFLINVAGLVYAGPAYIMDHSICYFIEKAIFGAPVPIFPNGRLLLIGNETNTTELMETANDIKNIL